MNFDRVTPESVGIHTQGILDFIELCKAQGLELHSMMLLRHGKVCAEGWWKPYNPDSPHMMFSFTKALTSTAVGFAWQEGKLSLTDRLCDLFPDKMPENPSENLLRCTVFDLLTMSCGHETEINTFDVNEPDWIANFMKHEFPHAPGTCFMYNTAGTNLLCAALKRRTGEDLTDYLEPRLFRPLGMDKVTCFRLPDGIEMGGAGSRIRCEDMARFITFIANKGMVDGRQLLDPKWFEMATQKQISTISPAYDAANPDWRCGYGFQFWRCVPEKVYRADGAFGQYGIVFEDKDAILILQSASPNQQDQLTCAWKTILPAMTDEAALPEAPESETLRQVLQQAELQTPLSMHSPMGEQRYGGKVYVPEETLPGLSDLVGGIWLIAPDGGALQSLQLQFAGDRAQLVARQDNGTFVAEIGMNSHYALFSLCGRTYGAVGRWRSDHRFEAELRCAESVGGRRLLFSFREDGFTLESESTLPISGGIAAPGYRCYTFRAQA